MNFYQLQSTRSFGEGNLIQSPYGDVWRYHEGFWYNQGLGVPVLGYASTDNWIPLN